MCIDLINFLTISPNRDVSSVDISEQEKIPEILNF